ncbi:MAG TPA: tetratricopeptide repeat protein, partial [Longimicrobiales bacterium]|nr:tetratricopeptide repeat protein [Longimicrobiales bacterium]
DRFSSAMELVAALEAARDGSLTGRRVGTASAGGVVPEGARRQATVVVSVLTEYDQLVERHVPDRLERLLGHLREQAQAVALAHAGILNEFTGERIVMLFGVPLAREDDAHRATRAALELQERVSGLDGEAPVRLHTGIDTGTVVTHGLEGGEPPFRVTGGPPQAASRIADQAEAGEVWVSAECRSAISPFYELVARAAIKLRGRDRALEPYRVLGESGLQTKIDASERTGLTAFTGRDAELQELGRCLEDALAGEGRLIIVSGDAGLGKSRLLHEFRKGLMARDVPVLVGRCQPYGGGVAYLPFIEILRDDMRLASGVDELIERVREISTALEEFIPLYAHLLALRSTAHPLPRHLQGDAFRLAMQEALAAFVTLRAQRTPVVMVLEDWHWADDASQRVLRQIAEVLQEYPLLVLVSSRPGYGVTWDNVPGVTRIVLDLLTEDGTDQMLRSLLRAREVDGGLVGLIHERTAGNPFYIEEICQALVEEGAVVVVDGAARLAAPPQLLDLPDSIQSVIRARLDRLEREARDVLKLASVVGREFARSVLERGLDDSGHLQRSLDALKAAGLVRQMTVAPDPRYRFKHVLTQEVAYASLLEHQRRELHGRVGAVMEAMHGEHTDDQLDRLAHHFSRAGAWQKAVAYGLRSAAAADRLAQFAESLQILERAQRWLARFPEGDTRDRALVDILLRQERLCETLGQRNRQQQLIDELIGVLGGSDDRAHLAEVYLRQGDLHTLLGNFDRADRALRQSLELRRTLEDPVGERNTLRSIGLLRWHEGRNAEALAVAEETLRLDRERDDLAAIVGDLTNCGAILRALGEHERARDMLEEALAFGDQAAAQSGGDGDELAMKRIYALQHLANIHREQGDRAAALECLHRAGTYAERKRLPIQLAYHYTTLAHVYLQEGEVEACLRYYRDAIALSRKARHAPGLAVTLRIYGEVLTGLGRQEDALPPLYEAASLFADLRDVEGEAAAHRDIAEGAESLGRFAEAVAAWGRAVELRRKLGHRAGELVATEGLARTTRAHVPEPTLALMHYRTAAELAQEIEDASVEGRLRNVMGILEWQRGEFGLALEQYEQARRLFGSIEDPGSAALMLNSIGATLRALGRVQEAEERLQEALETHRRHGFGQLEGHALALLGDISADRDYMRAAAVHYLRSLEIRRRIGDVRGEGWMLHGLARCELTRGDPFRVREHAAAAARIAEECGDHELASACASLRRIAD